VTAASTADLRTIYASVVLLSVMGIALFLVVLVVQSRLLKWHGSSAPQDG